ncbi:hypothetical protein COV24_01530 [candidate division WWE3 bacterium CG10_big_fil_rev_8_21_14_0_10_32_10]|uniref:ATP synthase subunit a n=1 Tax=candidate division WWE3 bacterium CG10_big_fil_rev_8_21_14_0_10_32_10 TaxID=1975090 RepID=A0A2H0RBH0_UNCKA|nr:MAG: hypothetical protein COV24_01530 [candidate division WWE3 bacterium CG10_big_fil_rev_8_21_14_0_10_32_10]
MLNITLNSEYVLRLFGLGVTNTFLTSLIVSIFLMLLSLYFYTNNKYDTENIVVKVLKITIIELLALVETVIPERNISKKILPVVASFFLFIVAANLLALVPGFLGSFYVQSSEKVSLLRSPNSDLTTTLALALFAVFYIHYFSVSSLGIKKYLMRFFNFSNPINLILGFFELLSEISKVISFSFRLFGNVFGGEILLLVIAFLVPYIIPLPFLFLEIFVGIVQAFIFSMLTITFVKTSVSTVMNTK